MDSASQERIKNASGKVEQVLKTWEGLLQRGMPEERKGVIPSDCLVNPELAGIITNIRQEIARQVDTLSLQAEELGIVSQTSTGKRDNWGLSLRASKLKKEIISSL